MSNREARRLDAQRRREEIRRKEAKRRRTTRLLGIVGGLVVVAGVVVAIVLASGGGGGNGGGSGKLEGLQEGPAPWPPETAHLAERARAIGLPELGVEQLQFHIHSHVDIFIDGQPTTVPAGIGIQGQTSLAVIHTHDDSGVIHVESPVQRTYTLGDFFEVWGVRFTNRCIGGYCAKGSARVQVFVDGKPAKGNPTDVPLRNFEEIVVAFGTPDELPDPVPSTCTTETCQGVGIGVPSPSPSGTASPSPSGSGTPTVPGTPTTTPSG